MKRTITSVAALALAAACVCTQVAAANAAPAPKAPRAHVATHPSSSSKIPGAVPNVLTGYQQVSSDLLTDPAGSQVSGAVTCPRGTKVVGGGAVISSTSLAENLNGSLPTTNREWTVYVNNASAFDGTFRVYAVCVTGVRHYSIVQGSNVDNPDGNQTTATASCPGTAALGGGGVGTSLSTAANLNSSIPLTGGWRVDMNNNSGADEAAVAFVVCGTAPVRYKQVHNHSATTVGAGTQGSSVATCPSGTVVFGGGGFSSSPSVVVDLNSTLPAGTNQWQTYENNNDATANTVTAYVVCGKAA